MNSTADNPCRHCHITQADNARLRHELKMARKVIQTSIDNGTTAADALIARLTVDNERMAGEIDRLRDEVVKQTGERGHVFDAMVSPAHDLLPDNTVKTYIIPHGA